MKAFIVAFFLIIFTSHSYSQTPNDCVNAITICGNGTFTSNATGIGATQEVAGCSGFEHNSIWLKINIINGGTLGFNLTPINPLLSVDYDFWVYGANKPCNNLGSPIRCCTTNPIAAGLSSNVTGMIGTTVTTASGPGSNGNGFVRWLNVLPGEFYYIAIDRPAGDGGFQLQWTGTAMNNGGAFPTSPTANSIGEIRSCSVTPNVGIFDFNGIKSQINPDIINNTFSFYLTAANAIDGISPLPNIYGNISNPQTIYAKVKNNITDCFTIVSFQIKVYEVPNATISTTTPTICSNQNGILTINGTPNAIVEYNINNGPTQTITLDNLGVYPISNPLAITSTFTLTKVKIVDTSNVTLCSQNLNNFTTITIIPDNTVTPASASPAICLNTLLPTIVHTTTGATGIGVASGLPNGVTANWAADTITISGTPIVSGTFNYSIPLTGGCGSVNAIGTITVNSENTFTPVSITTSVCVNTILPVTTYTTTGATGIGLPIGLPSGLTATWTADTLTISGTPIVSGVYNYVIPLTGGCGIVNVTGSITVNSENLVSPASTFPITCVNTVLPIVLHTTTGATGIGITSGLPQGVSASLNSNTLTISGTPSVSGIYNYSIPLTGGCGLTNATGTITVTSNNTVSSASITPMLCVNDLMQNINHTTTGATGIGIASGLPNGVTANWVAGTIIISGTPIVTGTFNYSIPLTGGCGSVSAIGTITVNALPTNISITGTSNTCAGYPVNLTITATPGTLINWSGSPNNLLINASGSNVVSVAPNSTTIYELFNASLNGCSIPLAALNATVTVSSTPQFVSQIPDIDICTGGTLSIASQLTSTVIGTNFIWSAVTNNVNITATSGDQNNIDQIATLINNSQNGTISLVVTPKIGSCAGTSQQIDVIVNAIPVITSATTTNSIVCSNQFVTINLNSNLVNTTYNWQINSAIGVQIAGGVTNGTNTTGILNLQLILTNPLVAGTISFDFTPINGVCSGALFSNAVILTVNPIPGQPVSTPVAICSGEPANLLISTSPIIAGSSLIWIVTDYQNVTGFTNGNALSPFTINDILINDTDVQGFVKYQVTSQLGNCDGGTREFIVYVNPLPKPSLIDGNVCVNQNPGATSQGYILNAGISSPYFTFQWYKLNATTNNFDILAITNGPTFQVFQPGTYQVVVTNTVTNCKQSDSAIVSPIYPANGLTLEVSDAFSEDASITAVFASIGNGNLLYSIDGGSWQVSNVFSGVDFGTHEIKVIDIEGCTNFSKEVFVIDYPKYFTPNGDGVHDTWYIKGINKLQATIHIFDRYGKLLKKITSNPYEHGWDGTYLGSTLPSTDYWFTINYIENQQPKIFRAHFALKR